MTLARSLLGLAVRLAVSTIAASFALTASLAPLSAAPPRALSSVTPVAEFATSAPPSSVDAEQGIIAYVKRSTHDIHVVAPNGSGDRVLWIAPKPITLYPAFDLAWRPDGRELAFSSEHELMCSWYESDVYAISHAGAGYRRITNSPACAGLAVLPKGSVTVNVANYTSSLVQVYVQGAAGVKSAFGSTVTFDNVADLGPGVLQPAVGVYGGVRVLASPPLADVQPGQTVAGGNLVILEFSGINGFGTGKVSWKADGSALAYAMRTSSRISQIPATPPYGSIGEPLAVVQHAWPRLVAWGPTPASQNQYLYASKDDSIYDEVAGIYLNTVGDASGGAMLVPIYALYGAEIVYDIEWLPDASGFLFSKFYVGLGFFSDIFEYNFSSRKVTQLTSLPVDKGGARGLSISPNGQAVVFEWVPDEFDSSSSLWIINRDGSGLRKLADDAGRPAWGRIPQPLTRRINLPALMK